MGEHSSRTKKYMVDVPVGRSGPWRVEKHTVSDEGSGFNKLRAIFSGTNRYTPPGDYTGLIHDTIGIMMSDAPDEIRDHLEAIRQVEKLGGEVLVMGLGLGVVLNAMLMENEDAHVTIIENSPDVIKLVEPHWRERWGDRFKIIEADAMEWRPEKGQKFTVAWYDIWPTICEDNLPQMAKLKRRFARRVQWQGAWAQYECRRIRDGAIRAAPFFL